MKINLVSLPELIEELTVSLPFGTKKTQLKNFLSNVSDLNVFRRNYNASCNKFSMYIKDNTGYQCSIIFHKSVNTRLTLNTYTYLSLRKAIIGIWDLKIYNMMVALNYQSDKYSKEVYLIDFNPIFND